MQVPLLINASSSRADSQFCSVQTTSPDSVCVFCLWKICHPSAWEGSFLFSWEPFFPFVLHTHRAPPSSRRPFQTAPPLCVLCVCRVLWCVWRFVSVFCALFCSIITSPRAHKQPVWTAVEPAWLGACDCPAADATSGYKSPTLLGSGSSSSFLVSGCS